MSDFISTIASKSGVDAGMAEKGIGALLSTLQQHVPKETYSEVSNAIPNASSLLSGFLSGAGKSEPTALSGIASLAGGLLGGKTDAISTLVSQFSKAGFSLDMLKAFVPVVLGYLSNKLSPNTVSQVEDSIPGLSKLLGGTEASGVLGKLKSLF